MESLTELYRIGAGPSASHTMGPKRAAERFLARHPESDLFRVTLFGSLAATGKGHLTDAAIIDALAPHRVEIVWKPNEQLPVHPNGMQFESIVSDEVTDTWQVYSVGGGALAVKDNPTELPPVYDLTNLEDIITHCADQGITLWEYVIACEGEGIMKHLLRAWSTMSDAIDRGLDNDATLPGVLKLKRKAKTHFTRNQDRAPALQRTGLLTAYALAVSEENASGGTVVTAPTCGACGVMPAVMRYTQETLEASDDDIIKALATAGLVGNLVKHNASISGAAVGCQGEVGTACSMAAAASAQLMGGSLRQIEYAAEMGIEHHLGLTCDPVAGLVQIPCIERNAVAAMRAVDCADYALLSDGEHTVTFDQVVQTLKETGQDLAESYRETSRGGLARVMRASGVDPDALESNHCG